MSGDLRNQPTLELLGRWRDLMNELLEREVVRGTAHSPVGDYAEMLVRNALNHGATRPDGPDKGVDIEYFPAGEKRTVQVKARRHTSKPATHFDVSRFEAHSFDELACVLFHEDWHWDRAWLLQWDAIDEILPPLGRKPGTKLRLRVAKIEEVVRHGVKGVNELKLNQSEDEQPPRGRLKEMQP